MCCQIHHVQTKCENSCAALYTTVKPWFSRGAHLLFSSLVQVCLCVCHHGSNGLSANNQDHLTAGIVPNLCFSLLKLSPLVSLCIAFICTCLPGKTPSHMPGSYVFATDTLPLAHCSYNLSWPKIVRLSVQSLVILCLLMSLQVLAPLAIGMTLFVCHLIAIPVDGCS